MLCARHPLHAVLTFITCYVLGIEGTKMKKSFRARNSYSIHLVQLPDYIGKEAEIQKGKVTSTKSHS